jgi:hypothetical protein
MIDEVNAFIGHCAEYLGGVAEQELVDIKIWVVWDLGLGGSE